jgi:hypothetical protein
MKFEKVRLDKGVNWEISKMDKVGEPQQKPLVPSRSVKDKMGRKSDITLKGANVNREPKPTPQRNEPIISEATFGVHVHVVLIHPCQNFSINLTKSPELAEEVY